MPGDAANPPKVFISYSHDSPEHADRVLELADRLRADGLDCMLDQYADSPPEGWPRWTDQQLREANFVLVICTPTYNRRAMGTEEPGKGLGVRWESSLTNQYLYNAEAANERFIPVLLERASFADIPTPLQGTNHYRLPADYERLYRRLTDQPLTPKPPIGPLRALSPRPRRQDFFAIPASTPQESPMQLLENVPYERNPFFTGREDQLDQLQEASTREVTTSRRWLPRRCSDLPCGGQAAKYS
jgi:hypothetical protein